MDNDNKEKQPMYVSCFLTEKDIERATEAAAACDNKECKGGPYYICLWCLKGASKNKKRRKKRRAHE